MFKPRSPPPVAGGAFFSWGSDRATAEPKSGAARAPADRQLNSRLEKPRRPGSLFIPNPFPNEALRAPGVGTNRVEWCRTNNELSRWAGYEIYPMLTAAAGLGAIRLRDDTALCRVPNCSC